MNEQVALWDIDETLTDYKAIKSTDWKWNMATDYPAKNGLTAFSCFACGGGSTRGYKLCGVDVLGCCEIDKKMNDVYVTNHKPKYNYLMDIRKFNELEDLPKELFSLDILDGSPPCTTFSTAGKREKSWGKKKKFYDWASNQKELVFISSYNITDERFEEAEAWSKMIQFSQTNTKGCEKLYVPKGQGKRCPITLLDLL